jgi:UDP-N-acetylglucosamine 2-epimerase (hydrolysing)
MSKKIVFITGTRADFGKLKSIILETTKSEDFNVTIFTTGMHMLSKYGYTFEEVKRNFPKFVYGFVNQNYKSQLDEVLSKTVLGFSDYVREVTPDLIIVHGDRVEALAGAIVGSLNHILVAHIEGGEISGTIDDSIRHAISKFSHIHFVSNEISKNRLINMGENTNSIYEIGSPDFDVMSSDSLPSLSEALAHYSIPFKEYCILLFHPVTSEISFLEKSTLELVDAIIESGRNFIVIQPNNDPGTEIIQEIYREKLNISQCRYFPSIRFEYFLALLKNADLIIGNSSAGIREAPFFGVPSINIGTRQRGRSLNPDIINLKPKKSDILSSLKRVKRDASITKLNEFGFDSKQSSSDKFMQALNNQHLWDISIQKIFNDTTDA